MKKAESILFTILMVFLFESCSAALVPKTNDPKIKLDQAYHLIQIQERPLPAERLIWEAIEIYENENNLEGLAKAYWTYGVFFQSKAVKKLEKAYKEYGFMDKSARFETRYKKALGFFQKAELISTQFNNYHFLANISWNKGNNYELTGDMGMACKEYDLSLKRNKIYHSINPEARYFIPGYGDVAYKEYKGIFFEYLKSKGCK